MKQDEVIVKEYKTYITKTITFRPDSVDGAFSLDQTLKFANIQKKKLQTDKNKIIIRCLNILRDTTLCSYNGEVMDEQHYNDYLVGKVQDTTKFQQIKTITITIKESKV
jgi:hypothetical protein